MSDWYNAIHLHCPGCKHNFYAKSSFTNSTKLMYKTYCPMCGKELSEKNKLFEVKDYLK